MGGDYSRLGGDWSGMVDAVADWQAALLRRCFAELQDDFDAMARMDVERGTHWRGVKAKGGQS